jgi:aminoglycoside/choline kinase family phosphotransferase
MTMMRSGFLTAKSKRATIWGHAMDKNLDLALEAWKLENHRPLLGDVGTRRYFRVDAPPKGSAILVLYPDADSGPQDAFHDFLALHEYLKPILRVPIIYEQDASLRAILLEDVGDNTLEAHMSQFPHEELHWADKVAWELADWVGPLTVAAPSESFFMLRSFDMEKYDFEWAFCKKNFFNGLMQKNPPLWLDRMMGQIHDYLIPRAKYLAHRDFHVRNLMAFGQRPVTIDFQDARLGPATYDLASIMFDGYWDWGLEAKQILFSRVKSSLGVNDEDLWSELNSMALQRNFKALGTFAFQIVNKNETRYASAVPRTLRHILGHFERMSHGEGVIQAKHWIKLAMERMQSAFAED